MSTMDFNNLDDRVERAIADRLARLRALPVDTSRLEARLRQQIPQPVDTRPWFFRLRPVRFAAAGVMILGIMLAAIISSSGGPALASADTLAAVHEDMTP